MITVPRLDYLMGYRLRWRRPRVSAHFRSPNHRQPPILALPSGTYKAVMRLDYLMGYRLWWRRPRYRYLLWTEYLQSCDATRLSDGLPIVVAQTVVSLLTVDRVSAHFRSPNHRQPPILALPSDRGIVTYCGQSKRPLPFSQSSAASDPCSTFRYLQSCDATRLSDGLPIVVAQTVESLLTVDRVSAHFRSPNHRQPPILALPSDRSTVLIVDRLSGHFRSANNQQPPILAQPLGILNTASSRVSDRLSIAVEKTATTNCGGEDRSIVLIVDILSGHFRSANNQQPPILAQPLGILNTASSRVSDRLPIAMEKTATTNCGGEDRSIVLIVDILSGHFRSANNQQPPILAQPLGILNTASSRVSDRLPIAVEKTATTNCGGEDRSIVLIVDILSGHFRSANNQQPPILAQPLGILNTASSRVSDRLPIAVEKTATTNCGGEDRSIVLIVDILSGHFRSANNQQPPIHAQPSGILNTASSRVSDRLPIAVEKTAVSYNVV
ncbi:hypothetical protein J6590_080966 [Homalodisca vitripennis]|nr:hypothetical protein J6590_080966 [Homalodisca vitripennis]